MTYGNYQHKSQEKEVKNVSTGRGLLLIEAMKKIKEVMVISIEIARNYPEAAHQEFDDLVFEDPAQKETLVKMAKELDELMDTAEKELEKR